MAARTASFAFLKLFRENNNNVTKMLYSKANTHYKALCVTKKQTYFQEKVELINSSKSSAQFWKAVKLLNGKGNSIASGLLAEQLKEHFSNLLNPPQVSAAFQYAGPMIVDEFLNEQITCEEVETVILNTKKDKAPGDDRIPFEFYQNCTPEFLTALVLEFNRIFETADVPASFRKAIIFPLYKKGGYDDPSNYRGISFLNTSVKLFAAVLFNRLTKWVENKNILSKFQAGFRKNYSTVDQIFALTNIAETYKRNGKKLYACFVDFRAAFDSIPREALFYKLYNLGISTKIIKVLRAMYEKNVAYVWDGKTVSDEFGSVIGVKQGCVLSSLLFILYLNDITEYVRGGIEFNRINLPALLYADDIVFLADTVESMQLMINRLERYCSTWNLSVNLSKSKMMIFRKGGGRYAKREKWYFQGEEIEIVREYKYLGVIISSNLDTKKHLQAKLAEAKRAMCSVWESCMKNKYVTHTSKDKLFRATAKSILLYGAQVWGYCLFNDVEKFLRFYIRRTFRLPSNAPNYMLHLETGMAPLFMDTLKLHFDYVLKVLAMEEDRIPKIVLSHMLRSKGGCVGEWERLASETEFNLALAPNEQCISLKPKFATLLEKIGHKMYDELQNEAQSSQYRAYYSKMNHFLNDKSYFVADYSIEKISTIFRIRGELIHLNFIPHRPELPILCDLCNLKQREDVFHFLAICPILRDFRQQFFGVRILELEDAINILNGSRGWDLLYKFTTNALRYRSLIVNELF